MHPRSSPAGWVLIVTKAPDFSSKCAGTSKGGIRRPNKRASIAARAIRTARSPSESAYRIPVGNRGAHFNIVGVVLGPLSPTQSFIGLDLTSTKPNASAHPRRRDHDAEPRHDFWRGHGRGGREGDAGQGHRKPRGGRSREPDRNRHGTGPREEGSGLGLAAEPRPSQGHHDVPSGRGPPA